MVQTNIFLGIDIGGSSLKAAPVDVTTGALAAEVQSIPLPQPATPDAVADAARGLAERFNVSGPLGCTMPAVVTHGIVRTAANIDTSWVGTDGQALMSRILKRPVVLLNDADAAGMAEIRLGAGRDFRGSVMVLTFGTGIGSALFVDGKLFPNTELGHLQLSPFGEIEQYASGRSRAQLNLDWPAWAARANAVLAELHRLFWPDVFILSGGLIEHYAAFAHLLHSKAEIRPAAFRAHAGIVGAALAAAAA